MGNIITSIKRNHFDAIEKKAWDKTYWFFDLHATIIVPNYERGNIPTEFYPHAKEVLQMLTKLDDVCLIMFTCSHPDEIQEYHKLFAENGIEFDYVNENPEITTQHEGYGCYDQKPYMNVLFEDKAGFDAEEDWILVKELLEEKYGKTT